MAHHRHPLKIAFCGSRVLDVGDVADHLLRQLVSLPPGAMVLLRRARSGRMGDFERLVQVMCDNLHIDYEWRIPDPGGRESVFVRDIEMAEAADAVVAYFAADTIMAGGTGHVVEKALDADKATYAYAPVGIKDEVLLVGGHDPDSSSEERTPLWQAAER